MEFLRASLLVLLLSGSVHSFVPSHLKNTNVVHGTFSPRFATPFDSLPSVQLPDLSLPDLTAGLDKLSLTEPFQTLLSTVSDKLQTLEIPVPQETIEKLAQEWNAALAVFVSRHPEVQPLVESIQQQLQNIGIEGLSSPASMVIAVSAAVLVSFSMVVLTMGQEPPPSRPYPNDKYDPITARAYFDIRPGIVLKRGLEVATTSVGFGLNLLIDYAK